MGFLHLEGTQHTLAVFLLVCLHIWKSMFVLWMIFRVSQKKTTILKKKMVRVRVVMKKRMMVIVATKTSLGIQFQPTLDDPHLKKAKGPETVLDDRLANFTGFGLLDDSDEDEVPYSTVGSFEAVEKEPEIVFNDRSNFVTSSTEVEVIDLMTPSPTCRAGSSMKRPRVSEFIDLT
ncbi:hypothetical protein F2Q70_00028119, partial [Brassica cretica]